MKKNFSFFPLDLTFSWRQVPPSLFFQYFPCEKMGWKCSATKPFVIVNRLRCHGDTFSPPCRNTCNTLNGLLLPPFFPYFIIPDGRRDVKVEIMFPCFFLSKVLFSLKPASIRANQSKFLALASLDAFPFLSFLLLQ